MRKIEEQMNEAIRFCTPGWSKGNTAVIMDGGDSKVYLHGNHIATVNYKGVTIFDGGWRSNTTKSRLNAIIDEFTNPIACNVFQSNYQWYIKDHVITQPFENGYHFAS